MGRTELMNAEMNYLTPKELCARYRNTLSETTLANWRASGQGPAFLKAGGRVLYPIQAVLEWEQKRTKGVK